jgi:hypothetical protein
MLTGKNNACLPKKSTPTFVRCAFAFSAFGACHPVSGLHPSFFQTRTDQHPYPAEQDVLSYRYDSRQTHLVSRLAAIQLVSFCVL